MYVALVIALTVGCIPAFATSGGDPLTVINNLSTFIFSLIRAIGLILLGVGIVQIGLSLKSHDPSCKPESKWFLNLSWWCNYHLC